MLESSARLPIDTDVLTDHLKNCGQATRYIQKAISARQKPLISIISRIELLSGSRMDDQEEKIIKDLLRVFEVVSVDEFIADLSAELRRRYHCEIADAIIAASAYKEQAVLATRNLKHFKKIQEISVIRPYKM